MTLNALDTLHHHVKAQTSPVQLEKSLLLDKLPSYFLENVGDRRK